MSIKRHQLDLVPGTGPHLPDGKGSIEAPATGFLVTNQQNLMYMLAAGLLMPPSGFGDKHYRDSLSLHPGWIPLFFGELPESAIRIATEEASHLRPVAMQIRLSDIRGTVRAVDSGSLCAMRYPEQVDSNHQLVLIPAPLPVSLIEKLIFPSPDDMSAFKATASEYSNVVIADLKLGSNKMLFSKTSALRLPPAEAARERKTGAAIAQAAGGVMAVLMHFAYKGTTAVNACRIAFDPEDDPAALAHDPVLAELPSWMHAGAPLAPPSLGAEADRQRRRDQFRKSIFWGFIKRLTDPARSLNDSDVDVLFDYLQNPLDGTQSSLRSNAQRLCETLDSALGLADVTISELFERNQSSLVRALILFCLRKNVSDLADFRSDLLSENDWLTAAILFGVRGGLLDVPAELRSVSGLPGSAQTRAISHRMARIAHRAADTDLDFGPPPPRIRPLRELLADGASWSSRERSAAVELSRAMKWDCIRTRISLPRGEYSFSISGGSLHIDISGEPRITPEVDLDRFFRLFALAPPSPHVEKRVRAMLPR